MRSSTSVLARHELRMMFNHFRRTLTTPSMLAFYAVMVFGALFIMYLVSVMARFGPLFVELVDVLREYLPLETVFAATGLVTVTAVFMGYFGASPASVLEEPDENVLMAAPVYPYQVFLGRYLRRVLRKIVFLTLGVFVLSPVILAAPVQSFTLFLILVSLVLFLECNYLLGAVAAIAREKLSQRTSSRFRHLLLPLFCVLVVAPSLPGVSESPIAIAASPANCFALVTLAGFQIQHVGIGIGYLVGLLVTFHLIALLVAVNLYDERWYEAFSTSLSRAESESRVVRAIRGEVDFSDSDFTDPMVWIMLKDFWSRMRSPLQFWKYLYVVVGIIAAVYLHLFQPPWLQPLLIPSTLVASAVPAFMLLIALLGQMVSMPALVGFVDEKENIYLLKSSPFKKVDIVLAKYLGALIEVGLNAIPLYGLLLYIFRVQGSAFLVTLAAPMLVVFCATGTAAGAYIPVFTSDPTHPPVSVAFSFPAINLTMAGIIIVVASVLAKSALLLLVLPLLTLLMSGILLASAVKAIDLYK